MSVFFLRLDPAVLGLGGFRGLGALGWILHQVSVFVGVRFGFSPADGNPYPPNRIPSRGRVKLILPHSPSSWTLHFWDLEDFSAQRLQFDAFRALISRQVLRLPNTSGVCNGGVGSFIERPKSL